LRLGGKKIAVILAGIAHPAGLAQNANSCCKTEITSNCVFGPIVPSFLMIRVLSMVRI
jgi:hypothetical protein